MASLHLILGDEELSVTQGKVKEDTGFADFDKAISEMAKAEETGTDETELAKFQEDIDKAIKTGALHRNTGARKKSRAARLIRPTADAPQD